MHEFRGFQNILKISIIHYHLVGMDIDKALEKIFPGIIDLSKEIYRLAEPGSEEIESSRLLSEYLSENGFKVEKNYKDMKTAFHADNGHKGLRVGLLAEYDALPNGHSCGHNLIAAWAAGTAATLNMLDKGINVQVFGTPSEEGNGPYAGSKCMLADMGAFNGTDFALGVHPDDRWGVGGKTLADTTLELKFRGRSAHGADSPEKGINALDAAVAAYGVINSLRGWAKLDKHLVVGMIFTEAGKATNVVPDKATLQVEFRSTSTEFLAEFENKVREAANGVASAYGADLIIDQATPLYKTYVNNSALNSILKETLSSMGIDASDSGSGNEFPSGSTDEANVSWVVPTGHLDFPIGYSGIPGHSDEFREAANPDNAKDSLYKAIQVAAGAILQISRENKIGQIRNCFKSGE